jgi:radical SAM protein with 4Fe4S-binding SPASM domain
LRIHVHGLGHKLRSVAKWVDAVRSYDIRARQTRLRGPRTVQIQTIDRCNAACVMCPYSTRDKIAQTHVMDDDLYRHILDEIRRVNTLRSLQLMLQNEPLLDRKLPDRGRLAREILGPGVQIEVVTNGSALTTPMIDALADSEIDRVSVSLDAAHEDTFAKIRHGLDFQRVKENTLSMIDRLGPGRVDVKFLVQRENEGEATAFANYWRPRGVKAKFSRMNNRAGSLVAFEAVKKPRSDPFMKTITPVLNRFVPACPLPFYTVCVLWDGKVITCSNDWGPRDTVGDLATQTLEEIWHGEKMNHYRHLLRAHRAEESLVCAGCSLAEGFWSE